MENKNNNVDRGNLKQNLSEKFVWAIAYGSCIGWGAFILPGDWIKQSGPIASSIGIVIGALLMILIAVSYGALVEKFPVSGGAFGAHGLEDKLSDKYMSIWEKATTYQMYHGLGLLVIGLISGTISINVNWAGWLLFFGIVFFSGSLYFLALTQVRILGAITPIGGVLFIIGWLVLVIATLKFAG